MTGPQQRELYDIVTRHGQRYPLMEPCDGVKLLYQNEFGPGHLVASPAGSLDRLRQEAAEVPCDPGAPLLEEIGGGMVRVGLAALRGEGSLEQLNRDFVRSAVPMGDMASFGQKLALLRQMAGEGRTPFSVQALDNYLGPYRAAGCPMVSHSKGYRLAYRPAYRVVAARLSLHHFLQTAQGLADRPGGGLIAIDGRCASGKSTLARRLARDFGWSVVPMDHFFLRPQQRTQARYATPGENIDHERFLEEVLLPLRAGRPLRYRPFDCHTMELGQPIHVPPSPVTVIEGSYACHPALWPYYDLRVFLTADKEEQMERIVRRDGAEYAQVFEDRWIPLEEAYFSAYDVEGRCDYSLQL